MKKISFSTLKDLSLNQEGLTSEEVTRQRQRFGMNEIVEVVGNPLLELARDTAKDPMIWFLVIIGTIFSFLGNKSEAITLFVAILPLVLMDVVLHWRTRASTSGLKSQLASQVKVLREKNEVHIQSNEVVPGDILFLEPGLFLPADGYFRNVIDLQVDESVLTGEAFPISKISLNLKNPYELANSLEVAVDPNSLGYAGTRVLRGTGFLIVLATGLKTEYGEIVQSVSDQKGEQTPLQHSISKLVKGLIYAAGILCLLLAGVRIYQGHGWLDAFLSAATLAVAAIPEEFPVVFTFFLGVGVYRLARKRALVRRAVSVENIGRVTFICTDKTGTITRGQLELTHLDPFNSGREDDVLKAGAAASDLGGADPVDLAIQKLSAQRKIKIINPIQTFPFTEERKRQTSLVIEENGQSRAFIKGSPEVIISLSSLSTSEKQEWLDRTAKWASEGHKVIACAAKSLTEEELSQKREPQDGFDFYGLLAFEDPARPEVSEAISYCKENGIHVLMITGDHPLTAVAIAKNVGLGESAPVVISAEDYPEKFEEVWLSQNPHFLRNLDVVARCKPIQKLRIVNALKSLGELVAVTGDGVNDVPALKAADIGIAMGERGTRSAKEVSSIILADDNFRTIVSAIREGGQLYSNLKKSFEYLLLFHIPFVATAAFVPLLGYPLLYLPIHIVWLELIIHPTALFAFQQRAENKFKRIEKQKSFFKKAEVIRILIIGFLFAFLLGGIFYLEAVKSGDIEKARGQVMAALSLWSAGLVFYYTKLKNRAALLVFLATLILSGISIQSSFLGGTLHVSGLRMVEWFVAAAIVAIFVLSLSLSKIEPKRVD